MFIAERDAKCSRLRRSRAGHDVFSQRQTTSSSSRCSSLPHTGHVVGITHGWASGGRRLSTGATTLRDDVAALLDDHGVAVAQVLPGDVFGVVQRRHRDGRAGEKHRLEQRERRHRARPADVDGNPQQPGVGLLRRELERRRPPRKLRRRAEPGAQRELVHLDDDAVGIEAERPAFLGPLLAERDQRVDALALLPVRLDGQAPASHGLQRLAVASAAGSASATI